MDTDKSKQYRETAKKEGKMGLRLIREYNISADYEYHACFDGVPLCDSPFEGGFSIRSVLGKSALVSDWTDCPKCRAEAELIEARSPFSKEHRGSAAADPEPEPQIPARELKTARELAEELCSVRMGILRKQGSACSLRDVISDNEVGEVLESAINDAREKIRQEMIALRERETEILTELDALDHGPQPGHVIRF